MAQTPSSLRRREHCLAWHLIWTKRRFVQISRYTFQKKAIKINNKSQLLWHLLRMCSVRTGDTYRRLGYRKWKQIPWWVWIKLSIGNHLKQIKVDIKFDEVTAQLTHLTSLNDLWAMLPLVFCVLRCADIIHCHWLLDMMHESSLLSLNRQNERGWGGKIRLFECSTQKM